MPEWAAAFVAAMVANILQGGVALVWVSGLQRVAGPMTAALQASMLEFVLVIPMVTSLVRLIGISGESNGVAILRVDRWLERLGHAEAFLIAFSFLTFGSALIFLFQEFLPLWKRARVMPKGDLSRDPRLDAALERVLAGFAGQPRWRGRMPAVFRLDSEEPVASLQGVVHPRILVSSRLLAELDDQELDGALAHELAHAAFGGNARMIVLWCVRALQAMNPAALIAFRGLLEQRERACDELAAQVTGRPAALASALLKVHEGGMSPAGATPIERARAEVLRRIEIETTRSRVRALLDTAVVVTGAGARFWGKVLWLVVGCAMGGILWTIR